MSDISIVPETTLPLSSDEVREREARPAVLVRATQVSPVTVRLEDEVHEIRDEVRRLVTRLDGLEERVDGQFRRVEERIDESDHTRDAQFAYVKEWCEEVALKVGQLMGQTTDLMARTRPARDQNRTE